MRPGIRREVVVPLPVDSTFALLTDHASSWWPRAYTWSGEALDAIAIEPFAGGRCYERGPGGFTCDFGRVLACDPPHRLVFTWQIDRSRAPQPDPARASEVRLELVPEGRGTRLRVEHAGLERHGDGGDGYERRMEQAWDVLLVHLARAAAPEGPAPFASLRVCVDVPALEDGLAFYAGALGLTVARRAPGFAELRGAGVPVDLLEAAAGSIPYPRAQTARSYGRHWSPVHLDVIVGRLDAALDRALARGARLEGTVDRRAFGRIARLSDPFGHGLCLLELHGKGYDEPG